MVVFNLELDIEEFDLFFLIVGDPLWIFLGRALILSLFLLCGVLNITLKF